MANNSLPPLPPGFTLDQPELPPLPEGYTLDAPAQPLAASTKDTGVTAGDRALALPAGLNKAVSHLAGLPAKTGEDIINLGLTAYQALINQATGRSDSPKVLEKSFLTPEYITEKMNQAGIATEAAHPEDRPSQFLHTAGYVGGSSLWPQGSMREILGAAIPAAIGGATAEQIGGPEWAPVGALTPGAARATAARAKEVLATQTSKNLGTFQAVGAEPTVGTATDSAFAHGIENLLAKFPGGAGHMKKVIEKFQADIGSQTKTGVSAEAAGLAMERGISGKGGYLERTQDTWRSLDQAIAAKMPKNTAIAPSSTIAALDKVTSLVPGAAKTTGALVNPKLAQMRANLQEDIKATGTIPYEGLRRIRTQVGEMMENALTSDVPQGQLRVVYGALSEDMRAAANQAGAGKMFDLQNRYWKQRQDLVESVLNKVVGTGKSPEDIFKAIDPKDPDASTKLRATLGALRPAERHLVSEAIINKLGRAAPGKQDELGEVFSTETFLTNWNRISPKAKAALFPSPQYRADIEKVAKAAEVLRSGMGIMANPSGTAGSFAAYSLYMAPVVGVATTAAAAMHGVASPEMVVYPAVSTAATIMTSYSAARLMSSPRFVHWLAKVPKDNPSAIPRNLAMLMAIYRDEQDPETKDAMAEYVTKINENLGAEIPKPVDGRQ